MKQLIYYVAVSLDGYIAGPNEDISSFILQGPGVEHYQNDLQQFKSVIMGRRTYEFGYQYGLPPGQPAYPNMEHYIFSNSLQLAQKADSVHVKPIEASIVKLLKEEAASDIYLCGGGVFAGWLLQEGLIDQVKLKVNPIVLGTGTPLFGNKSAENALQLKESLKFSDGMFINTYQVHP